MSDCPKWVAATPPSQAQRVAERAAYLCAASKARSQTLEFDDPATWHELMFTGLVPLVYYAGNYRQADPLRICLGVDVAVGPHPGVHFREVPRAMVGLLHPRESTHCRSGVAVAIPRFARTGDSVSSPNRLSRR